jgi:dUTPase
MQLPKDIIIHCVSCREGNDLPLPSYGTSHSACVDLRACLLYANPFSKTPVVSGVKYFSGERPSGSEARAVQHNDTMGGTQPAVGHPVSIDIPPRTRLLVPTGFKFKIVRPEGFDGRISLRIHSRSSVALKSGLVVASEGIIDEDYGEDACLS